MKAIEGSLIDKIPKSKKCCLCITLKSGTKLIAIVGILIGFTCAAILLIKERKQITSGTIILIIVFSLFIIDTIMFVVASILLLMAAIEENPDLMYNYIWLSIIYLCVQLALAVVIPTALVIEGKYPPHIALIWMVIVMIVTLGWTHFISVVGSYRTSLLC